MQYGTSDFPEQCSLFPLDPWGADQSFPVIFNPFPGIACAMIGPIDLGGRCVPCDYPLYCIAASSDGFHIVSCELQRTIHWQSDAARNVWREVLEKFKLPATESSFGALMYRAVPLPVLRGDDFHGLFRSRFILTLKHKSTEESVPQEHNYQRIEAEIRTEVDTQWRAGLRKVLNALAPEIRTLIQNRPELSLATSSRLISQARLLAPASFRYVLQALQTESWGLLHLAATNPAESPEAQAVLDAILSGKSLPKTLMQLGISKAAHRKSLRPPHWFQDENSTTGSILFNLKISGVIWLFLMRLLGSNSQKSMGSGVAWPQLMRLLGSNPPQTPADLAALQACLEIVNSVVGLTHTTRDKWVSWCIQASFFDSAMRAAVLKRHAESVANAAAKLTQIPISISISINLSFPRILAIADELDHDLCKNEKVLSKELRRRHLHTAIDIAILGSGKSAAQFMQPIFDTHPGVPRTARQPIQGYTFHPITHYDDLKRHGEICNIGIQNRANIVSYLLMGYAFYVAKNSNGIVGTLALYLWWDDLKNCEVRVNEFTSLGNEPASIGLAQAAHEIALAWCDDEWKSAWRTYVAACSKMIAPIER